MKIHEYQAKDILQQHGVATLKSYICFNPNQILLAANKFNYQCAIKAQIHAGGRGKGGGIKIVENILEAKSASESIFGMKLVTPQTGSNGQRVTRVLVEESCKIYKELYAGLVLDRDKNKICLMASTEGGVEIEEVVINNPNKILRQLINPTLGLMPFQTKNLAFDLGLKGNLAKKICKFFHAFYNASISSDAILAEINPLVITYKHDILALDAKFNIDDNALFRQKKISEMHDPEQENYREVAARSHDLSYVALDGNIGCMVNGAGLAMSTMDIIKHEG